MQKIFAKYLFFSTIDALVSVSLLVSVLIFTLPHALRKPVYNSVSKTRTSPSWFGKVSQLCKKVGNILLKLSSTCTGDRYRYGKLFLKAGMRKPTKKYIGLELRYKRLYKSAEKACKAAGETKNFVIIQEFAEKLGYIFSDETLSETYIFFPDPWDKKESFKKKRLLQGDFLEELYKKTKIGGKVFFKTDHREYFKDTLNILEKKGLWKQKVVSFDYKNSENYDASLITEFEGLFLGEQDDFYYLELVK